MPYDDAHFGNAIFQKTYGRTHLCGIAPLDLESSSHKRNPVRRGAWWIRRVVLCASIGSAGLL
ncbi:hypothetical protein, partial [Paraburkholderia sp.]|uniref:hypothetical protein n=1 Tax=Paraburkholderia sp. TaxID=1926495 RepID=UPI002AFE25D3